MHILECIFWNACFGMHISELLLWIQNGSCKHKSGFGACDSKVDQLDARPGLGLNRLVSIFLHLQFIVLSLSQFWLLITEFYLFHFVIITKYIYIRADVP